MSEVETWARAQLPLESRALEGFIGEARRRRVELGLDETAMADRIARDPEERARLLEVAVPPESWLFRHVAAFELLRAWLGARAGRPLRMASLGCARGAEAYSMAATAAAVGRSGADTRIVAVDWNDRSLRAAAEGHASPLAQRGPIPDWAQPHFAADEVGWMRLRPDAMAMIEWRKADLLHDEVRGPFDVMFCRNVAIYLDESARRRLALRLASLAAPDALLCVGHADPFTLWQGAFVPAGVPGAFAFERTVAVDRPATASVRHAPRRSAATARVPSPTVDAGAGTAPRPTSPSLQAAQGHADAGRLDDAGAELQATLAHDPMSAEAWSLLGAVRLAQARAHEAEECFRRAVYLHPDDALALLQLSALASARGDTALADRLRLRASRAASGGEP